MLKKSISIKCFEINKCGYYEYGNGNFVGCDTAETFNKLAVWLSTWSSIHQTATFQPREDTDEAKIYCYDFKKTKKSFMFVAWNRAHSADGQVKAINGDKKIGEADVKSSKFPKEYIPGFETFFWIIPDKNLFFTVRFERTNTGLNDFSLYIIGFLRQCTKYCKPVLEGEKKLMRYQLGQEEPRVLVPSFWATPKKLPGKIEWIKGNRAHIRKVIQKSELSLQVSANDTDFWQKIARFFGHVPKLVENRAIPYRAEYTYTPSVKELNNIISTWEETKGMHGAEMGFQMDNMSGVVWLETSLAKGQFEVEVEVNADGIVDAKSLLEALESNEDKIFAEAFHS